MIEGKNALDSARNAFSEAGMSLVDDPVLRITGKKRKAPGNQGGNSKNLDVPATSSTTVSPRPEATRLMFDQGL